MGAEEHNRLRIGNLHDAVHDLHQDKLKLFWDRDDFLSH